MARELTSPELALLRSDGQFSKLYLAVYKPNVIYSALLNGVPASNDRVYQITFDGGSGTLGDVKANMLLYVGTSAGGHQLGMCRIRKAPIAGTIYIGLTSEITWADNAYLTIVDDFELHAKHATIASEVLAMDVDVGYSDQHSAFNPVPVMGPHAVAWLDGATVDVLFDGSDSWVIGSTISGHVWTAPGASGTSGLTTATPTITYNAPGCYSVYDTVTAANGKTTVGVRHVFVYDRDANPPATVFQLSQCIGDTNTGGWMFDLSMEAEASLSEIRDRSLVVLFAEDYFAGEKQAIGPVLNRENIVCIGRIVGESIRWDRESGLVHFTVQGMQHWLSRIKAFPVELSFAGVASAWSEMPYMTVDRALFHILYWHSTAIETMDFTPTGDTKYSADGKTIASNIWRQLGDLAFSKLFAVPGVDRFGRLFIEIDPQMVPEGDRDFPEVMQITEDDWQEAIDFSRVIVQDCSLISLNAEEVNGGGTSVTRYALSPGHVPLRYGEPEMIDRVLCASQADANSQAGLLLGWRTNQLPDVPVVFAENNRMIDCFPRQTCGFAVATGDTPREIAFDGQLIPRRVVFYFDGDTGYFHSEVNFEGETFEQVTSDGDIPDTDAISMETPPIPHLPPLPDLPILLPGLPGEGDASVGPRKVLVHDTTAGLLYSENFNTTQPIWRGVNAGLTLAQYQAINARVKCPNGAFYVGCIGRGASSFLARAPYVGGTFAIVEDYTSMVAKYSGSTDNVGLAAFACNPLVAEQLFYMLTQGGENIKTYIGAGTTFPAAVTITLSTNNGAGLSYGLGYWMLTANGVRKLITPNGATVFDSDTVLPFNINEHVRVVTSGITYHWTPSDNFYRAIDNMGTVSGVLQTVFRGVIAMDTTGVFLLSYTLSSTVKKSSDNGASFSSVGTLPVSDTHAAAYVSGSGVASCWIVVNLGGYVYYTSDFFVSSPIDKRGNLTDISPIPHLDMVMVVGL